MIVNQTHPLSPVLSGLMSHPRADAHGQMIVCTAAKTGAGTSHVTRSLAMLAAAQLAPDGKRVFLVDYDLTQQIQSAYFMQPAQMTNYGTISGPYDATLGRTPFWQVSPEVLDDTGVRTSPGAYCGSYIVDALGLTVTQFQWSSIRDGQTVHLMNVRDYWHAAREQFGFVLVDTPAMDRSDVAMNVIAEADHTVLISADVDVGFAGHGDLAKQITMVGGHCAGMILNSGAHINAHEGRGA